MLGYPAQAAQWSQDALTLAHTLAHPFSLAEALGYATWLAEFRREARLVHAQAEALMALAQEHGFAYWLVQGRMLWGWALVMQGHGEEGLAHLRQGLEAYRATAARAQPYYLALLAEAYGHLGESAVGLGVLAEALAAVQTTEACVWEAKLYWLKGALLQQATGSSEEAATCFRQALTIARRQQAKSWELRAALRLSRLWQQQDKCAKAHDLLAPIYGWFTEGFDTADLQEAKALLDELEA